MTPPATQAEQLRIVAAFIDVVADRGYKASPLNAILERAGVDESDFHRHFSDKEDCFVAAWEYILDGYMSQVSAAYASGGTWLERMRALATAIIDYLMENPDHARILFVEGPMAGKRARALLDRKVDLFGDLVDLGRRELDDPDSLTRATADGVAGAAYEQISIRLQRDADEELPDILPQLMFLIVRPYLGYETAMEELRRQPGAR